MSVDPSRRGSSEVDPGVRAVVLVLAILGFIQGALIGLVGALLYVLW